MNAKKKLNGAHFATTARTSVPSGRNGKHKTIISAILADLTTLDEGQALKIPLAELPDSKVNIRSALSRATRKARRNVSTAADDTCLYVWNS